MDKHNAHILSIQYIIFIKLSYAINFVNPYYVTSATYFQISLIYNIHQTYAINFVNPYYVTSATYFQISLHFLAFLPIISSYCYTLFLTFLLFVCLFFSSIIPYLILLFFQIFISFS